MLAIKSLLRQANFKPDVGGWGQKGLLHCATILEQIKDRPEAVVVREEKPAADAEDHAAEANTPLRTLSADESAGDEARPVKRVKTEMSVEEYEEMLDREEDGDGGGFIIA